MPCHAALPTRHVSMWHIMLISVSLYSEVMTRYIVNSAQSYKLISRVRACATICSTPACNNKVHHLCLAGSGLPLEYTESDSKDYLCYDCIRKKIGALPTPIPLEALACPVSAPAPSAPATTLPSAPATTPSPPASNFYF